MIRFLLAITFTLGTTHVFADYFRDGYVRSNYLNKNDSKTFCDIILQSTFSNTFIEKVGDFDCAKRRKFGRKKGKACDCVKNFYATAKWALIALYAYFY